MIFENINVYILYFITFMIFISRYYLRLMAIKCITDNITIFSCSVDKDIVLHIFLKILYIILKIFDTRLYKSVEDI